jgi:hypothetical protein
MIKQWAADNVNELCGLTIEEICELVPIEVAYTMNEGLAGQIEVHEALLDAGLHFVWR